jgi:hypothetical protein
MSKLRARKIDARTKHRNGHTYCVALRNGTYAIKACDNADLTSVLVKITQMINKRKNVDEATEVAALNTALEKYVELTQA